MCGFPGERMVVALAIGIVLGLAVALTQSVSFLCVRLFVVRRHKGVMRLLILGHVIMGVISAAALPLLWDPRAGHVRDFIWPLVGAAGFYLVGQASLMFALTRTDASRISPLLALKIVVLALLTVTALGGQLRALQWGGVALSVAAAFVLNYTGGRLPLSCLAAVALTCAAYAISDLNVKALVSALEAMGKARGSLLAVSMCYTLTGLAALALLPWAGRGVWAEIRYAAPFAISWLAAMVFLFACFAHVGVVFGNILQSTRGLFSILLGARIAAMGMTHLEQKHPRRVLVRRGAAAGMMCLAIALWVAG